MASILLFHQGWTDIINCLSLITYYSRFKPKLKVIVRKDAKLLVDFYLKNTNVEPIYYDKNILDNNINSILLENLGNEFLFFGVHDRYSNVSSHHNKYFNNSATCFVEKFYTSYDVPYEERINSFALSRNFEKEDIIYNQFVKSFGENYVLTHNISSNKFTTNLSTINLDNKSSIFFDYIKVISKANEIHLLDSSWAAIIYHLDCKYKLFSHIPITVYCDRNHYSMFSSPTLPSNWTLI
jgi:hypothetical protein